MRRTRDGRPSSTDRGASQSASRSPSSRRPRSGARGGYGGGALSPDGAREGYPYGDPFGRGRGRTAGSGDAGAEYGQAGARAVPRAGHAAGTGADARSRGGASRGRARKPTHETLGLSAAADLLQEGDSDGLGRGMPSPSLSGSRSRSPRSHRSVEFAPGSWHDGRGGGDVFNEDLYSSPPLADARAAWAMQRSGRSTSPHLSHGGRGPSPEERALVAMRKRELALELELQRTLTAPSEADVAGTPSPGTDMAAAAREGGGAAVEEEEEDAALAALLRPSTSGSPASTASLHPEAGTWGGATRNGGGAGGGGGGGPPEPHSATGVDAARTGDGGGRSRELALRHARQQEQARRHPGDAYRQQVARQYGGATAHQEAHPRSPGSDSTATARIDALLSSSLYN